MIPADMAKALGGLPRPTAGMVPKASRGAHWPEPDGLTVS